MPNAGIQGPRERAAFKVDSILRAEQSRLTCNDLFGARYTISGFFSFDFPS